MTDLADFIARVVQTLDDAGVAYMFVGSIASTLHGPPRSTQDIDLVVQITPAEIARVVAAFPEERYYLSADAVREAVQRRGPFNIIDLETGWKAALMVRRDRSFSVSEFGRRLSAGILGVSTWVATPEDTILSKLEWSALAGRSARQLDDVRGIVQAQASRLDLAYIEGWAARLGVLDSWREIAGG